MILLGLDKARSGMIKLAFGKLYWLKAFIDWFLANGGGQSMDDPWSATLSTRQIKVRK